MEYRSLGTIVTRGYFQHLREGECVPLSDVKNATGMDYPLLSFHISKLEKEGMITKKRRGKIVIICKGSDAGV